ncbi:MAG: aryl-alcohol dehydrogenase-like predicted oxidoreductase [Psychroserpens sp.]|jgi:aryl-alcohol dehydrogenase-like predicted oxidoreductase
MHQIKAIGLGTAAIGRPQYININQETKAPFSLSEFRRKGLEMLDYAYNAGIRYYDTAPGYGLAEQLLIDWLKEKNDPNITVATKWGYTYVANFDPNAKLHEVKEHSLQKLNEQWEVSKQLFPYLKYYQIHSATFESGILENEIVLERLFRLKQEHNIKVGLTTTGGNQTEVLKKGMDVHFKGEQLFEVFQCTYNILDQSIYELGCEIVSDKKQLVIKEALANGRLFPNVAYPAYSVFYKKLEMLSKKYDVGVDAISLQFCLAKLDGATILSGANKPEYLAQNIKVTEFRLSPEEIEELSKFKIDPSLYWQERKQLTWN